MFGVLPLQYVHLDLSLIMFLVYDYNSASCLFLSITVNSIYSFTNVGVDAWERWRTYFVLLCEGLLDTISTKFPE